MARCFDQKHLSYSRDRVWDECQWKAHLADAGAKGIVNEKMLIGSATDAYVSAALAGSPISRTDAWNSTLAEMESRYKVISAKPLEAIETHNAFCAVADKEIIPALAPIIGEVQAEWHYEVSGETYHAHPDFVTKDGQIIDLKTTYRRLDPDRVHVDTQLTAYAFAYNAVKGVMPTAVGLVALIGSKSGVVHEAQVGSRSEAQLAAWLSDAQTRIRTRRFASESDTYLRQGRASLFACKGCPVQPVCPSWAGTNLAIDSTLGE
jgi:hypothetical protein